MRKIRFSRNVVANYRRLLLSSTIRYPRPLPKQHVFLYHLTNTGKRNVVNMFKIDNC